MDVNESFLSKTSNDISPGETENVVVDERFSEALPAVKIAGAYKSYGSYSVLKNLNLNVPKGAIYGLLGPSGCGKTTILKAICGRTEMDSGAVTVFDHEPGTPGSGIPGPIIGYMPQEIALYNEFTIDETLSYFGYLHNVEKNHLKRRKEFLLAFLDLVEAKDRLVKVLSGGQKRRVSMMCALLQEPQLLILDEPTVGVDPLLREKIWDHLIEIATTSNTTIIITTHYIEEARKADRVGLMRNGRILAEDSPDNLLKTYEENSLENVFLKLCIKDQNIHSEDESNIINNDENTERKVVEYKPKSNNVDETTLIVKKPSKTAKFMKSLFTQPKEEIKKMFRLPRWHNLKGMLFKNTLVLRRDPGFLFIEFLIPIIQISLFCLCIGREPYDLPFGVVNNETIFNSSGNSSLLYIDQLNKHTFSLEYMNWRDAYRDTRSGNLWGYFDISKNFSKDTYDKYLNQQPGDTYNGSYINLYLDASNQQISLTIQARATEAYQNFLIAYFSPYHVDPSFFQTPIVVQTPIYGDKNPQFISFMLPGIMVTIIFTLSIGLTSLMFVLEKKDGLLERSWVAGVTTPEIMIAHVLVKFIIIGVQITILIVMATFVFHVSIKGPFIVSAILLLLQGFCGMSYGLAVSSLSDNEVQVLELAVATIFPSLLLSGIIWPIEGMPKWVRVMTNFSPLTHTAEAMRCIASRGWGLTHFSVWFGLVAVSLWSLFFNFIAGLVFTLRQ